MPIEVFEDDLTLSSGNVDHIATDHASDMTRVMHYGGDRKSKFFGSETNAIDNYVFPAFRRWKEIVRASPHAGPNGGVMLATVGVHARRTAQDVDLTPNQVGTDLHGDATTWVRLIMEITNSGEVHVVTAFPV